MTDPYLTRFLLTQIDLLHIKTVSTWVVANFNNLANPAENKVLQCKPEIAPDVPDLFMSLMSLKH